MTGYDEPMESTHIAVVRWPATLMFEIRTDGEFGNTIMPLLQCPNHGTSFSIELVEINPDDMSVEPKAKLQKQFKRRRDVANMVYVVVEIREFENHIRRGGVYQVRLRSLEIFTGPQSFHFTVCRYSFMVFNNG